VGTRALDPVARSSLRVLRSTPRVFQTDRRIQGDPVPEDPGRSSTERCAQCRAAGAVTLQQIIKGTSVCLSWCCAHCDAEWRDRWDAGSRDPAYTKDER